MKRSAAGTYPTYAQASKRQNTRKVKAGSKNFLPKGSVARTRGGQVNSEMKYQDTVFGPSTITALTTTWANTEVDPATTVSLGSAAVPTPLNLCSPVTGAALDNRIGRQIEVRKIKIHGHFNIAPQAAQAGADSGTKVRLVLVQDMQTNAGQMQGEDLFGPTTANGSMQINAFQDPKNFGRFRVLKDKMFQVSDLNIAVTSANQVIQASKVINFKMNVNFKTPVRVRFNATNGGTVADVVDNSFHILCATVNAAYDVNLAYYCRVCYKDA